MPSGRMPLSDLFATICWGSDAPRAAEIRTGIEIPSPICGTSKTVRGVPAVALPISVIVLRRTWRRNHVYADAQGLHVEPSVQPGVERKRTCRAFVAPSAAIQVRASDAAR